MFPVVWFVVIPVAVVVALIGGFSLMFGLVIISEREVGIVIKKFSRNGDLKPGTLVALSEEAGYQADTLGPGWHFGFWTWQYRVIRAPVTVIPPGEIGLVVAADGEPIPPERILAKVVDCDRFQNARAFLMNGGERGRQLGFLTSGAYRINTQLFTVITARTAEQFGMSPADLMVHKITPDQVGIVTTHDGAPIDNGEIAGALVTKHDNFQNAQAFMEHGGKRGLQEQVLLSGSWNLNPWYARVEQVSMTHIPIGHVGVVISFVGKPSEDVTGLAFTHGDLVNEGHKGVWVKPLYPGKHPINTRVMKVELVPTTNIVLNWANRNEAHKFDAQLSSITVRSADGFAFNLDVSQIIHIGALDAPKVISRVGSVQNLVDHVLQPIVGNYFRNAAQAYTVLDFLSARSERQQEAAEHIRQAVKTYDVQAIDTLIGDITPPDDLMLTLTERKIAQEQRKTYEVQMEAQTQRQELVRETSLADIQEDMVRAEKSVTIAELKAQADIKKAEGESEATHLHAKGEAEAARLRAETESNAMRMLGVSEADAVRAKGDAQGEAYRAGVDAIGPQGYTAIQLMQLIAQGHIRIVPDVTVSSGENGSSGALTEGLLSLVLQGHIEARNGEPPSTE